MTPQYANSYSQVRTPPYLEIQSYRILNYHVSHSLVRQRGQRGQRGQG